MPDLEAEARGGFSTELLLMLLADARLPSGGHTQSGGLEPALRSGMTLAQVPNYLAARLETVVAVAAGAAVVASHHPGDPSWLLRAWREWQARTPSPALRQMEHRLGRGYLRLVERVWGAASICGLREAASLRPYVQGEEAPPRPLVIGVLAGTVGLTPEQTARLIGYDDVQTIVAAGLKLEPFDPSDAARLAVAAFPQVEAMALRVASVREPWEIPASGAPQIDQWAEAHAETKVRLFSA